MSHINLEIHKIHLMSFSAALLWEAIHKWKRFKSSVDLKRPLARYVFIEQSTPLALVNHALTVPFPPILYE